MSETRASAGKPIKGEGAKTKSDKTKSEKAKSEGDAVPEVIGSEAAFQRFLPEAQRIGAKEIKPLRASAALVYHNVKAGTDAVMVHAGHLKAHLPQVDLRELAELPQVALALAFAALLAEREVEGSHELKEKLSEAASLRTLLLASSRALAAAGVFSDKEVAKIDRARGPIDTASDCMALGAMFTKHAAEVKGKSPVTSKQAARASELGAELKTRLKAKGVKKMKGGGIVMSAGEARDRLYTLLAERHERLWAVGAYLFGYAVDEHVPALLAPMQKRKGGKDRKG